MKLDNIRNIYTLGDLHLGIKNNSIEWFNIQRDFLVDWFIKTIKEDGFDPDRDILLQVGDWNHIRESINIRIDNESDLIWEKLSKVFKRGIFIILGNHDVYYKDRTDINSLKKIPKLYSNVHVFKDPEVLEINGKSHNFLLAPWEHDVSKLSANIKKYGKGCDYVVCHADINDFSLNKWVKIQGGLSKAELSKFKKIYAGHIHIRQSKGNVTYVGTPYQLDRGDIGNDKGFYKLNVEGDELIETFIENTHSPRFIKVDVIDILNKNYSEVSSMFKNNFVDVLIDSNMAKIFPINRFINLLKNSGHRLIEFVPYHVDTLQVSEAVQDQSYEYNIFEILSEYLKMRELPGDLANSVSTEFKSLYDKLNQSKDNEV